MLESALQSFQSQVESTLDRANTLAKRLRRLKTAAQTGDLREIDKSIGDLKDLTAAVEQQAGGLSFEFDETGYFPDRLLAELVEAAKAEGLTGFAQDGKLYCYPLLGSIKA